MQTTSRFYALFLILFISLFAFSGLQAKNSSKVMRIDTFEDGNATENPKWWAFGDMELTVIDNKLKEKYSGTRSLHFSGKTKQWYVGGVGTYFGIDGTRYNAIKMYVKGIGPDSGSLMIELYDDDNENWHVETDEKDLSKLKYDDQFVYTLKVGWNGWKTVIIPFNK